MTYNVLSGTLSLYTTTTTHTSKPPQLIKFQYYADICFLQCTDTEGWVTERTSGPLQYLGLK